MRSGNTSLATTRRQTSPDPVKPPWAWGTKVLDRAIDSARLHQVRADSSRGQSTQEGRRAARAKGLKPMDSRASTRARLSVLPVFIALLLNIFMVGPIATAPSRTLALTGSTFDATDGNLAVEAGEKDWCSPSLTKATRVDPPSGSSDNSFQVVGRSRPGTGDRRRVHPEQQGRLQPGLRNQRDRRGRPLRVRRIRSQRHERHRHAELRAQPVGSSSARTA